MLSRRNLLIGAGAVTLLAGGGGVLYLSRLRRDIRAPLLYAYGIYEYANRLQVISGQVDRPGLFNAEEARKQHPDWTGGPLLNRELHNRYLNDHTRREITTPNNDTLYTSAVLDLSKGPVEVTVPDVVDRYLSIAFMDPFNDQIAYIGTRATNGQGGRFWVIGPGQDVSVPAGVTAIQATANDLWMLGRIFVFGASDLEAARSVQSQIKARPVDPSNLGSSFITESSDTPDPATFLALTNEVLGRSPITGHAERAAQFSDFGIQPGELDAFAALSPIKKLVWERGIAQVENEVLELTRAERAKTIGWTKPPEILGNYGTNDAVRAGVAIVGFGALTREEAMYFGGVTDSNGDPLDGTKSYRMVIPASGIPVRAFWSLSMYEEDELQRLYFYDNELNRYSINSSSEDLTYQPDGSIVLALQPTPPDDPSLVWMPTPNGPFQCVFRTYLPEPAIMSGNWQPPQIVPI
mgnify:CR=1 FL=1